MAPRPADPNSLAARVRALVKHARAVDQAKVKLDQLPNTDKLRAEFTEATRRAGAAPNDENLQRLERASKALRGSSAVSKRAERVTNGHADALHKFRLELGRLANDTKGPS